ncbi:hypothetical protein J6590_080320 [Homalodisca vitripennis]|nr:hypothetical protein J6590_080320 [Homalodisca vitripennis]
MTESVQSDEPNVTPPMQALTVDSCRALSESSSCFSREAELVTEHENKRRNETTE